MKCPFCHFPDTFVKDSRDTADGAIIRRRRNCNNCSGKFTTFERVQLRELIVVKRSGAKKSFDRNKIEQSIKTALRKRNLSNDEIMNVVNKLVLSLENGNAREIATRKIGEMILNALAEIDQVAYIRFASVYKDFSSARDFAVFVNKIKK